MYQPARRNVKLQALCLQQRGIVWKICLSSEFPTADALVMLITIACIMPTAIDKAVETFWIVKQYQRKRETKIVGEEDSHGLMRDWRGH